ncbi:tail protein [Marinomonas phage CB5A]|uniref:Tail tubular protein B n=1 Tax=Marinomonas phage CB5A TaxID=2022859 RepID=A0A222G2V8_9CAUD|nr:tail protein [Marinomonas phage CB5A]ASP46257.1 tail tubular protein B [Marinomonas phage CB5A]
MGKKTGSWARPIQGVSQQTDKDRVSGQCTLQENFTPSPLYGLVKRVGSQHVARIDDPFSENTLFYSYSRGGTGEDYLIVIEPYSYPRVFTLEGQELTVNNGDLSDNYLKVSNPKEDIAIQTIADYSFIVNKEEVVEVSEETTDLNPAMAIVYCQYATYGRDYIITANGSTLASYSTRDGSEAAHVYDTASSNVASKLASQISSDPTSLESRTVQESVSPVEHYVNVGQNISYINQITNRDRSGAGVEAVSFSGTTIILNSSDVSEGEYIDINYSPVGGTGGEYTAEVTGNTIYVTRIDGERFSVDTIDGADGDDLIAVQDRVSEVSKLPPYAPEGYVVKVQPSVGYDADAYWLRATSSGDTTDQTGSDIRWVESLAQGEKFNIKIETLPHILVSEADGTFSLSYGEWEDKRVGNELTNPFPSFVDNTIQSIGIFQNRLVLTSREAAIFSRTNLFFDFFRESTQVESDSDPIDVYADARDINFLTHSAVLDGDIVFFADNGQFLINGSNPITKSSLVFKKVTSYPFNSKAAPAVTGESVMFTFSTGLYAGIREMFTDSITDTKRARPITEHIAEYIEGTPIEITTSPNINKLVVRTDRDTDTLYMYDWLWNGDQKVQSAFHKWRLDGKVLFTKFVRDSLYLIVERGDNVYLEYIPVANDVDDEALTFSTKMDQKVTVTASFSAGRWEFSIPYTPNSDIEVVMSTGCYEEDIGNRVNVETSDGINYYTYDDIADWKAGDTTCTLIVGTLFTAKYIPTQPFILDYQGRVNDIDRFTLNKVAVNYVSSGDFRITVKDKATRREWVYNTNGRRINSYGNRAGFAPLDAGSFAFPVRLLADLSQIELTTDDYRPLIIRDLSWEGQHKQRGQRI